MSRERTVWENGGAEEEMRFISFLPFFFTLKRANKASKAQGPFFTRYYKPSAATVNADLLSQCAESYPVPSTWPILLSPSIWDSSSSSFTLDIMQHRTRVQTSRILLR